LENLLGEFEHLGLELDVGDIVEIILAQRGGGETVMPRLDHDDRSRFVSTIRPSATTSLARMASRITAKVSCPTRSSGVM
jgi:hypothetical protein